MNRYRINTFSDQPGGGNPTAVYWADACWTEAAYRECARSEAVPVTAFLLPEEGPTPAFTIRYFTALTEIPACGHATLAAVAALREATGARSAWFRTLPGTVIQTKEEDGWITLEYPRFALRPEPATPSLLHSLGLESVPFSGFCPELETLFLLVDSPARLRGVRPDFRALEQSSDRIKEVVLTSPSDNPEFHFLLRSFCPWIGIDEDPVTGSVHSALAPFWQERLNVAPLLAWQASERGGTVRVQAFPDRVELSGRWITTGKASLLSG
ncbi:MAG TPA: PhzF family phenazine biosynthesis isomerase [Chitinophagaceae bacterium]|jgi:PhzF family phenazine biosynthesis protein|nr:PhzF family phenazine biosynthesis isomerase [Chitinophagaceae bacterium]